jgi:sugar phosphate isomerase/epimerase
MQIQYLCPFWGQENTDVTSFFEKVIHNRFDGIEIHLPDNEIFIKDFYKNVEDIRRINPNFCLVLQHLTSPDDSESLDHFIAKMKANLERLAAFQPTFINSHTGKDYFSFEENCRVIEATMEVAEKTGVRILHETHRGRFSFHAASLLPYLERFPDMELVGDFSHFCVVSESILTDQKDILTKIIPRVSHIHARVGNEQTAQIPDPFAPEWSAHLSIFTGFWRDIIVAKQAKGWQTMTITPEAGPAPYMAALPFTLQPIGNQWNVNLKMKKHLKNTL